MVKDMAQAMPNVQMDRATAVSLRMPNEFVARQNDAASRHATGQGAAVCGPPRPGPRCTNRRLNCFASILSDERLTSPARRDIKLRTNRSINKMARLREFDYDQVLDGALRLRGFRSEIVSTPAPDCGCLFGLFDRATHRVPSGAPSKPSRITPSPSAKL